MKNKEQRRSQSRRSNSPVHAPTLLLLILLSSLVTLHSSLFTVFAAQWPSLFRGVVVAEGPIGIRVVSVDETSQASLANLRPEDVIVQINDTPIRSLEEFAEASQAFKGRLTTATVFILRNGQPRDLTLHLYSYPLLRHWDLVFVHEHDIRFVEARAGRDYWLRMARGFLTAGDRDHALNAYLNALHNTPTQLDLALTVSDLLAQLAQQRLHANRLAEGLAVLQQHTALLNRLFEHPLTPATLEAIKAQLEDTLRLIKEVRQGLDK